MLVLEYIGVPGTCRVGAGRRESGGEQDGIKKEMGWDGLSLSAWGYTNQCRSGYGTSTRKKELGIVKCVEMDLGGQDTLDMAWC